MRGLGGRAAFTVAEPDERDQKMSVNRLSVAWAKSERGRRVDCGNGPAHPDRASAKVTSQRRTRDVSVTEHGRVAAREAGVNEHRDAFAPLHPPRSPRPLCTVEPVLTAANPATDYSATGARRCRSTVVVRDR